MYPHREAKGNPAGTTESADPRLLPTGHELVEVVGATVWGTSLLVKDPRTDRRFLLTVLDAAVPGVLRFALICIRLSHPCLVRVARAGTAPTGELRLLTALGDGPSVWEWLERGRRFPAEVALRVVADLAGALDYLSGTGLGHGAVSPHAVTLSAAGVPRLRGFGPDQSLWDVPPSYRLPATPLREAPGAAADVYGLGRVLRAMLTGDGMGRAPLPLATPDAIRTLVMDAMDPDSTRFPGPQEFARRCVAPLRDRDLRPPPAPLPSWNPGAERVVGDGHRLP